MARLWTMVPGVLLAGLLLAGCSEDSPLSKATAKKIATVTSTATTVPKPVRLSPGQPGDLDTDLRYQHRKDGDSFAVTWHGHQNDIRLIGINCPEKGQPGAEEARAFTHAWMSAGPVGLEYDQERFDRYGRVLAYVWRDGEMLNLELVRAGLCPPRYYHPNGAHRSDLEAAWPR